MRSWSAPVVPELPDRGGEVRLASTVGLPPASPPEPQEPGARRLYVCGITPYDATHLGHAATYVGYDLLVRAWLDTGVDVRYVQNVTDVDDPLLDRARETGVDWVELAAEQTELFRSDMTALRVVPPTDYVGAVESVPLVVEAVSRMLASGAAYRVPADDALDAASPGDVYADLSADPGFGSVSGMSREEMLTAFGERGGDPERPGKKDALDPLLWRVARADEPAWDGAELGEGRPGWHIECACIAATHLGLPIDVQGGGSDLLFPHHEMSESHLRVLTDRPGAVRLHAHGGMVGYEGTKMSKSLGNLVLVSRLVAAGEEPAAVRLALLAGHYAADREYSDGVLASAKERLATWRAAVAAASPAPAAEGGESGVPAGPEGLAAGAPTERDVLDGVRAALRDDLDSPRALEVVDEWAAAVLAAAATTGGEPGRVPGALVRDTVDALLGVDLSV
ncbi:cysteine--1-D-myo-inosityl 2-amino-2-deoxy-alpha-D-glucopyranoside ligase [Georgenia sp. Z1491]|uniref:cysteine--1-D-myo-inosityl 2-amino-2-deoxy-alpha-D-glucopyranoside ligase n=1 Tax=Georgenia sp. Z1491 TaxID=3416707 RepID=UPI003CE74437